MAQGSSRARTRAVVVGAIASSTVMALALGASATAAVPTDTSRIVGRARNSAEALWVAVSPNGTMAYATTYDSNALDVIDLTTLKRLRSTDLGAFLTGVSVSKDGRKVFVGAGEGVDGPNDDRTMTVASASSGRVLARVPYCEIPAGNAISPNGKVLYQTCSYGDSVAKLDTTTNKMIGEVLVGLEPVDVAFSPDGAAAYTANTKSRDVSVIDTRTGRETATIPVGPAPTSVAVSPDGTRLFVSCSKTSAIWVVNTADRQVVGKVKVPAAPTNYALVVSPDGSRLYVGTKGVTVVDTASLTVLGTISVQTQNVADLVLLPGGRKLVAVAGEFTYVVAVAGYSGS
jgi:YVTN family beta-propeller protein